ncbi:radical SAM mobile pair protein B [Tepidimonas alkaliphilus]|uniref:Radical SAM mobile pair protein B n=1 Tax=Tepidimonas alkaliphilus TaxID=2588942 RepID=A0A554W6N0_9BURK|nr:PA0069 family radical SAM protein [Tepidimonas alkaliphilus]TSE19220.1 radical SAM mobile pair protein B [Tepidimonas alkaliphilus]
MRRPPPGALKGRGSGLRLAHRFQHEAREPFDDGWEREPDAPPPARTELRWEEARSALTYNDSPDIGFDRSLNPYRGCEHGCAYCYARPTHAYLDLSPGLDFETVIVARRGLEARLRAELARPGYRAAPVAIGTVTDAYQPLERELRLTRALLQVLAETRHPWVLVTKGSGVERDLDLIAPMAAQGLCAVYVTVTTLQAELARRLEPRAAAPWRRLRTIRMLADAGVPVGVSVAPQIPFLNDDLEAVLAAAAEAGARCAFYTVLRLPWEVRTVFADWLRRHYPERAARVLARVRDLHGGRDYDAEFGARMTGRGVWAELWRQRFAQACRRLGLATQGPALRSDLFRSPAIATPPAAAARPVDPRQLSLFD